MYVEEETEEKPVNPSPYQIVTTTDRPSRIQLIRVDY